MRRTSVLALGSAMVLALSWGGSAAALPERAAWGVVPSPNRGSGENELARLAVIGPDDIWAVGRYNSGRPPTASGRDTLGLHWDGATWAIVPTPNPRWEGADFFTLEGVAAVSSAEVWAVGYAEDFASLKSTTLIERWDGVRWRIVRSPNPGGTNLPNRLAAVAAGAGELWAVGGKGFPEGALILRWDGSRWRSVTNNCGLVPLAGLEVISASDMWAVGSSTVCHYNGLDWQIIPSPQPRGQFNEIAYGLLDVSAAGPNDVWASGYRVIDQGEYLSYASIVEHWDGVTWTLTTLVPGHSLNGVRPLAPDDVWAVGTDGTAGVVAHFDGSGWSQVPSPTPGGSGSLAGLEVESTDHLWAAGTAGGSSLVLESPSRFEGTVTGATHVSGATVSWFGPESGSTETDPFGHYAAPGLLAGTYRLVATYPGCSPGSARVVVAAGQTLRQDLHLTC